MFYILIVLASLPPVFTVQQKVSTLSLYFNRSWKSQGVEETPFVELPASPLLGSCATAVVFGRFALLNNFPVLLFNKIPNPKSIENVRLEVRRKLNCFNFIVERMRLRLYEYKVRSNVFQPRIDRETVISLDERVTMVRAGTMDTLMRSSILSILDGKRLEISGNHFPPYVYSKLIDGVRQFGGANYQIVNSASSKLNFTFYLDAPMGKPTGSLLPNGTWTGLFGDVFYKKSDLAIVLAHTVDRNGLIDFTTSFGAANLIFSTAFPKVSLKPEAIVYSYDYLVWSLIFVTISAMIPAVYFSLRRLPGNCKKDWKGSLIRSCTMIYKMTLEQCAEIPPGLEILAGMYLMFIIIIGTGYKSNLLASLSFPEAGKIPRSFPDLATNTNYDVHFDMSGIAGYNYFMQGDSPMLVNLRTRFAPNLVRNNPAKCAAASFLDPSTVCIGWDTVLNQAIGKNLTLMRGLKPVYLAQEAITRTWVTIGLQKNSQYTAAFNYISSSYFETGHITKWHKDIVEDFIVGGIPWMKSQKDSETYKALIKLAGSKTKTVHALKLNNVYIIFLALTFGVIIATLTFAFEMGSSQSSTSKNFKGKLHLWKTVAILGLGQKQHNPLEMQEKEILEKDAARMEELKQHYIFDFSNYTNNYEPELSKAVDYNRGDEFKVLYLSKE
ncbi:unnamed protein product [Allacma fusca]|uniref:Ionotropic glutamate receptor L-glutamate and glycine-binding domain-containing protein n=1 Tax=Allacma fusca TaxID=39272 RepID=A0A8J2P0R8_9HEXA|nr:unnamed protein product [Allacma fusca]